MAPKKEKTWMDPKYAKIMIITPLMTKATRWRKKRDNKGEESMRKHEKR